jgi:hypothetical protein
MKILDKIAPVADLQEANTRLKLHLENEQMKYEVALSSIDWNALHRWTESAATFVDPREPYCDTPEWTGAGGYGGNYYTVSTRNDKRDGAFLPLFRSEHDLEMHRGTARALEPIAAYHSISGLLRNYTIGAGSELSVLAKRPEARQLARMVEEVVEAMQAENNWRGQDKGDLGLEVEIHDRRRRDGEAPMMLEPRGWRCKLRLFEPACITEPADKRPLETWIDCKLPGGLSFPPSWSFGVLTRENWHDEAYAYHCVWDQEGRDYDILPASRVVLNKLNVDSDVKRGVSSYFPVAAPLAKTYKAARNTLGGAAVQSAIAGIREHMTGTTERKVADMQVANTYHRSVSPTPGGGTRTTLTQKFDEGTIIDSVGAKWHMGPLGSSHASVFIEAIQMGLRWCGMREGIPEYMISGDASNANMASTTMAESPFVKAREGDQRLVASGNAAVAWRAVGIACEAGYFRRLGVTDVRQIKQLVEIAFNYPSPASRDTLKQAQTDKLYIDLGVLSKRTAATAANLDYDLELAQGAKEAAPPPNPLAMPPKPPGEVAANQRAMESCQSDEEKLALFEVLKTTGGEIGCG